MIKDHEVYLVIGASSYIGKTLINLLLEKGHIVIATYNSNEDFLGYASEHKLNKLLHPIKLDVSSREEICQFFLKIKNKFSFIHHVVYLPGIVGKRGPIESMTADEINKIFNVNFFGFLYVLQNCKNYVNSKELTTLKSIIGVSSEAGFFGGDMLSTYASSKAAMNTLVKGVAREFSGLGIRVNAVSPGLIKTENNIEDAKKIMQIPLRRYGNPIEVAKTIFWLSSEDSSYINGSLIPISGGR